MGRHIALRSLATLLALPFLALGLASSAGAEDWHHDNHHREMHRPPPPRYGYGPPPGVYYGGPAIYSPPPAVYYGQPGGISLNVNIP